MPEYTFHALSPYDLEILTRDLLQAELGIRLESFTHGRDRGIDLRYAEAHSNDLVVQVKHFVRSGWNSLLRAVAAEFPKIQTLSPRRYILVTSVPLNPDRKAILHKALGRYCLSPEDILGQEDLNNLLARHPGVERQHYKLWLTSVPILERILHSDAFADQASELEHIRQRVSRFVTNPSVRRALDILATHHYCVITGVPGIGKTTLAEMLLIDHLERDFDCFRIWESVGEARKVFAAETKQLFYFDDFLGRTGLRQPDKNEDERLLRLIRDVVRSDHHRLLLTSRDYILHQAAFVLEGLTRVDIDPGRCVVALADYTPQIRAEILYNHLFHSGLPQEHIDALVTSRAYRAIIRHRNYSPRIIEAMTDILNVRMLAAEDYPAAFIANLDDPRRLWDIAYNGHITQAAQNALLVVASLADNVLLLDAAKAFERFHRDRCDRYSQPSTPHDWERALKELEGTFLSIDQQHGTLTLSFHNPSVRDYLESRLREHPADAVGLIMSAVFPDQLPRLQQILGAAFDPALALDATRQSLRLFSQPSGVGHFIHLWRGGVQWRRNTDSPIARLRSLLRMASVAASEDVAGHVVEAKLLATNHLAVITPDIEECIDLLETIADGRLPYVDVADPLYLQARAAVVTSFDRLDITVDGYEALLDFVERHPAEVTALTIERLTKRFNEFAEAECDAIRQLDADARVSAYEQLETLATRFGSVLPCSLDELMEDAAGEPFEDEESRLMTTKADTGLSDDDLDSMFDSLRTELP